jgi:hypothetical protein
MSNWINFGMIDGSPEQNNYSVVIDGLDSNSVYEFRAYSIVDNIPVYGDVKRTITLGEMPTVPDITTGSAHCVTTNGMRFCGNKLNDSGSQPINEYGVLYTQNTSQSTNNCLVYNNQFIRKKSLNSTLTDGQKYFIGTAGSISDLEASRVTYFRAFAVSDVGIGYGEIKTKSTLGFTEN